MADTVLVTGASGLLGTTLTETLRDSFTVSGTFCSNSTAQADYFLDLGAPPHNYRCARDH